MSMLTPREIVAELDKYIIGQDEAKRKVAIALRNRWRRQQLSGEMREEVAPKNIVMMGPTGVGKTEIARRLSRLADAPFIKVEASKFTEVGYVGRDCESMIRELTEVAVNMVRAEMEKEVQEKAEHNAEERLLDILFPPQRSQQPQRQQGFRPGDPNAGDEGPPAHQEQQAEERTREIIRKKLRAGELDQREVEVDVRDSGQPSMMQVFGNTGLEEMGFNLQDMLGKIMPQRSQKRRTTVAEARRILHQEEVQNLIDMEAVAHKAIERTQDAGIVFLDEIDKIAGRGSSSHSGPDVSREGVQRDILPIVEGSTVTTKHGSVRTDHILFIAAGAFHTASISDMIPELQGRFPIRVELENLGAEDFERILREPKNSLIKQYQAMLETEGVSVRFADEAIETIARLCQKVNDDTENIGARRLHTIMENLLEEISYEAPDRKGEELDIDAAMVERCLANIMEDQELSKYIL